MTKANWGNELWCWINVKNIVHNISLSIPSFSLTKNSQFRACCMHYINCRILTTNLKSANHFLLYVRIRMIPSPKFSSCPPCFNMPGRNGFHSIGVFLTEKILSFPIKRETKVKEYTSTYCLEKLSLNWFENRTKRFKPEETIYLNISPRVSNIHKDSKKQKMYANKAKFNSFWDSKFTKR